MADSTAHLRTFKYRLYPTPTQELNLFRVLTCARNLYNMALGERKYAYQIEGRSLKLADIEQLAKRYRATFPYAMQMFSQTAQIVVKQVDTAFQAFFRRVKAGQKPGYPRFKNAMSFNSFEFKQYGSGAKINGRCLKLYGIGRLAIRWHRPVEGTVKTVRIVRKGGRWYVTFACDLLEPAVQRQQEHVANQCKDYLHKLSTQLVQTYDGIALEALRVKNMVRNKHLSKSILDSGWTILKDMLTYKAESAGRQTVFVNPAYTSKKCSNCGSLFEGMTLATRWVTCNCGLSLDRDHNAAINILRKSGWDAPVPDNVERSQAHASVRSPRL